MRSPSAFPFRGRLPLSRGDGRRPEGIGIGAERSEADEVRRGGTPGPPAGRPVSGPYEKEGTASSLPQGRVSSPARAISRARPPGRAVSQVLSLSFMSLCSCGKGTFYLSSCMFCLCIAVRGFPLMRKVAYFLLSHQYPAKTIQPNPCREKHPGDLLELPRRHADPGNVSHRDTHHINQKH